MIFDVQRVGPSTGLPTRTAQGDILSTALLSHGDTKHILLIPSSVEECYDDGHGGVRPRRALPDAVFVMSDLDLGMNNWMADPFPYPDKPLDRGKLLDAATLQASSASGAATRMSTATASPTAPFRATACRRTSRADRPQRQGPVQRAAGRLRRNMDRLARKFETARAVRAAAGRRGPRRADRLHRLRHVALGDRREPRPAARGDGVKTSYLRLRAYPFTDDLGAFIDAHERVYVVEQNRDAQLLQLMKLELSPERSAKLRSVLHYNGLPIDARSVTDDVLAQEGHEVAKKTVHPHDARRSPA